MVDRCSSRRSTLFPSLNSSTKKLVKVIRAGGYRGYLPIETLAMGRRDYDPYAAVTGLLAELRAALANPE